MYPFKQSYSTKSDGANVPQQWPLNQAAYQNVANDEVDWAALAAQWIYMKETCPYEGMPEAPPPPKISKSDFEEKGEAPMEVEKDDEQNIDIPPPPPAFSTDSSLNINRSGAYADGETNSNWNPGWNQQSWRKSKSEPGWNTWTNPNLQSPSSQISTQSTARQPLLPDPFTQNNMVELRSGGYWTGSGNSERYSNKLRDTPNRDDDSPKMHESPSEPFQVQLDANKRKTLPAWIRQGLEKMEREKQKTAEKEREAQQRLVMIEERKHLGGLTSINEEPAFSSRSKFDSESDSDSETKAKPYDSHEVKPTSPKMIKIQHKSKQEQLQDLMLVVRSTLTEILLEVTNEEIRTIASDTLAKMRSKARKAKPVRKTALSSLTGGLGLGIYADSDNSGNSSSDESNDDNQSDDNDSDIELKEIIKRRKCLFESKSREIEAAIAIEEEKERHWNDGDEETKPAANQPNSTDNSDGANKDSGEIQHENNIRSHGHRREKKASRFSDPTDTVKNLHVTHGSIIYDTVANPSNKSDNSATVPRASFYYDNNKDSDSSSSGSNRSRTTTTNDRRKRSHDTSSGDSDSEHYRKRYKSKEKNRRKSRSSSSERKYRSYSSSHKSYNSSLDRKIYDDRDRGGSSSKESSHKSTSSLSSRDRNFSRSYSSNSSSRDYNKRKRSRSRSPHKSRKYY